MYNKLQSILQTLPTKPIIQLCNYARNWSYAEVDAIPFPPTDTNPIQING